MLSGPLALIGLAVLVLGTSFLSGVFGIAGGMVLMGGLLFLMPVPAAMILHGVTQLAANGWRAVLWWRYIDFRVVARFVAGSAAALTLFSFLLLVPDRATVLICLGLVPFMAFALPERYAPHARRRGAAEFAGFVGTGLQFVSGVSGPLLDAFLVRMPVDRRIIVASKSACQVMAHSMKLVYFGVIVTAGDGAVSGWLLLMGAGLAVVGTSLARTVLDRITDRQYRTWTKTIVLGIGAVYLVQGLAILLSPA
ncbi:MAG TPA: sulfite exporter TauE/SafE family protein [Aurantimonas coralicida]|uniref:Uncharacterized protein n=2 Tax=root TaxID=1 RepID=A0A0F9TRE9_9ZZZZ|nr:sulfite exporter TauE/SafE family protein [Aurantimonas coralicida]